MKSSNLTGWLPWSETLYNISRVAKVIPKITLTGPLIICRTKLTTTRGIHQIQASLKNYSECLYITDLVSVINFYINRNITLENTNKNSLPINTQIRPRAN